MLIGAARTGNLLSRIGFLVVLIAATSGWRASAGVRPAWLTSFSAWLAAFPWVSDRTTMIVALVLLAGYFIVDVVWFVQSRRVHGCDRLTIVPE